MSDKRKQAIRQRMALTGESYTQARERLFALWDRQDAERPAGAPVPLAQDRPLLSDEEQA